MAFHTHSVKGPAAPRSLLASVAEVASVFMPEEGPNFTPLLIPFAFWAALYGTVDIGCWCLR